MKLEWFKSYFKNKYQRTKVNGKISDWGRLEKGVPQGSILGHIQLILYINDIDTLIYAEGENEEKCRNVLLSE